MSRYRNAFFLGLFILGVVTVSVISGHYKKAGRDKNFTNVNQDDVFFDAKISQGQTFPLKAALSGKLEELDVKAGETVKKDQILGVFESALRTAYLRNAMIEFQLSQTEDNDSKKQLSDEKKTAVEKTRNDLQNSVVRAPVDGLVSQVWAKPGDRVQDNNAIGILSQNQGYEIKFVAARNLFDDVKSIEVDVNNNDPKSTKINVPVSQVVGLQSPDVPAGNSAWLIPLANLPASGTNANNLPVVVRLVKNQDLGK